MSCHSSCVFNESCGIVCCPNCGYQLPDERKTRVASALRRWFTRRQEQNEIESPVRPLSTLRPGQTAKIVSIDSTSQSRLERLQLLGLMPDAHITLEQKRPAYVLSVGFTQLSLDTDIAQDILVDTSL
ncbi:MAG: FeoA family protein [Anaerolineae bacterium]